MSTRIPSLTFLSAASSAFFLGAVGLPHFAFAQNGMPPGTRQWIELAANSRAACSCPDDAIAFAGQMPSPSPNYIIDPAVTALGYVIAAEATSAATNMQAQYNTNFFEVVFLRNSFVDTYTISGPTGTQGQPVAASVMMHTTGVLRVPMSTATRAVGSSSVTLEVGVWNPLAITEQGRVEASPANTRSRAIPLANYGASPQSLSVDETITVSYLPVVGVPFDVAFGIDLQGRNATLNTTIQWSLPPGYSLTSVLGYNSNAPTCDSIDFNADGLFPDDTDLVDFLTVLAGGECSTGTCNDIDFNNDGLFPDDADLLAFLTVLAGGNC